MTFEGAVKISLRKDKETIPHDHSACPSLNHYATPAMKSFTVDNLEKKHLSQKPQAKNASENAHQRTCGQQR